ncbi:MAG: DUF6804 family protein, partial [Holosporales bacterium]
MKALVQLRWNFPFRIYLGLGVLLLIAAAPLPYVYYTFTRVLVFGCSAVLFYQNFNSIDDTSKWAWFFLFIAILFNPFAVIHMTKELWIIVDIMLGLFFLFLAYQTRHF